ncbi:MAG: sec-independent protein translocase protein TatC [Lysobacterales bacterium]|jgi:sec-independent protein translocase protein TatC
MNHEGQSNKGEMKPSLEPTKTAMTLFQHMDELRSRLTQAVLAIIVCSIGAYVFIDPILEFIIKPVGTLVFTAPSDAFFARVILAILSGCIFSLPVVLFHVWRFVGLGLKAKESKSIMFYGPVSLGLFFIGGLFAYYVIVPIAIEFLLGFATESITPMITIKNYVSFVGTLILAFGVVFELPLILLFLAHIGIATAEFLEQKRRYAVIIILIVSALITPPDFITQLMMAGPLVILYEIGILAIKISGKRKLRDNS